ncbi:dTDP-4-dehydrorhamnose reductase [Microbulbifer sp. ZKSA006]|uniref:dTDP-4-dehydrorhamnose reductase n=1 Tax=Microbulbifer sp. ZKSA006 TaxID=3243390 RepID=UPI0040397B78
MKILVTGKNGQLGRELQNLCPIEHELISLSREELDISDRQMVETVIQQHCPEVIINAAAYTAVDKAEKEQNLVFSVNLDGALNLAKFCKQFGIRFIHISTDFVFDGQKSSPYSELDEIAPLGVYGASKAEAEIAIQKIFPESVIIRTAWVYSVYGNNFVNTMLRLMSDKEQLGVVADQVGTPTWTGTLAKVLFALVKKESAKGIYHCTDLGVASWYDFAVAIFEEGKIYGLIPRDKKLTINAITTEDYPTPAKRPSYSVLDKSRLTKELDVELQNWRNILQQALSIKAQKL